MEIHEDDEIYFVPVLTFSLRLLNGAVKAEVNIGRRINAVKSWSDLFLLWLPLLGRAYEFRGYLRTLIGFSGW